MESEQTSSSSSDCETDSKVNCKTTSKVRRRPQPARSRRSSCPTATLRRQVSEMSLINKRQQSNRRLMMRADSTRSLASTTRDHDRALERRHSKRNLVVEATETPRLARSDSFSSLSSSNPSDFFGDDTLSSSLPWQDPLLIVCHGNNNDHNNDEASDFCSLENDLWG